jgi:hypothetical protein
MKWFLVASVFLLMDPEPTAGWEIFSKVKFTSVFYKEHDAHFLTPRFDAAIRSYEEKEFVLRGYYLPLELEEKNVIILSRHPYSMCFFCGGAGPESVAEIHFAGKMPGFKADQLITVKGILKLNSRDITHLNFILKDAVLVPGNSR